MRHPLGSSPSRRKRHRRLLLAAVVSTTLFLIFISTRPVEPSDGIVLGSRVGDRPDQEEDIGTQQEEEAEEEEVVEGGTDRASCATVEKMGEAFADSSEMESLRVREVIKRHFDLHGILQIQARAVLRYTLSILTNFHFEQVLHFNYKFFQANSSVGNMDTLKQSDFRVKDWGPAPRWVAFVDFFLGSRAKHAVVSGAHRRVDPSGTNFKFFSSFQSNLLVDGLGNQIGWGHIWNRFAGPLSCRHQPHQCAQTPLLPPAWWDGEWQSPIPRDIQRLKSYGVTLTENGDVIESHLQAFCRAREDRVKTLKIISQ
ncbi:hypothetical protein B296_00039870 [Ensete ventricosum]|uniref:Uncharacterized protein n=1 Tax=Ensete ventricosum TaxID=4639 RepID=A0A426XQG2_ENSVE|nr:hypothetical protein B296_00039870 [Ensete ventricosum]